MIFKPILIEKILAGEKTVTRRPLPTPYEADREYAIQPGMARPSVGGIHTRFVNTEMLGTIDDDDAMREGFQDRSGFVAYWTDLYGGFDSTMHVARIEFELVETTHTICKCCNGLGVTPKPNAGSKS